MGSKAAVRKRGTGEFKKIRPLNVKNMLWWILLLLILQNTIASQPHGNIPLIQKLFKSIKAILTFSKITTNISQNKEENCSHTSKTNGKIHDNCSLVLKLLFHTYSLVLPVCCGFLFESNYPIIEPPSHTRESKEKPTTSKWPTK